MNESRFSHPDPEEQDFINRANAKLQLLPAMAGAKVQAFTLAEAFAKGEPYGLVMQYGGRRRSIHSAAPFCHASVDELVAMVAEWVGGLSQRERWTTDEKYAEGLL
jgi:hypothetical protein